ncbi:hypothetical protein [Engelhardtia mirabilis]|uniref:Uncharacterized protein n=1 Tax=Engelhardtia mirabilis TaxID=2528011 RepID=A0A518BGH4_9BACT|nr:hypothetical protein Pla133_11480 [Planctomycetes bacterium Pla133]QDV00409.1 hypothetical protein Pla86_11480 [Planctomycetes bacterium Pla86]
MPLPVTARGPSARTVLNIDWQFPVWKAPEVADDGDTVARQVRRALTREEALAYIAGDDPRPLLVLRECKVCNGTDAALLKFGAENEKTFLLSTWFHCVKLPVDVMEQDHPFHNLFQVEPTEHLFVATRDGATHRALESETSRTELWKSMGEVMKLTYDDKSDSALKAVGKLLDKLDAADERWNELSDRRDEILEEDGPGSRKLPKLEAKIAELDAERGEVLKEIAEAMKLKLKAVELDEAASSAGPGPADPPGPSPPGGAR